MKISGDTPEARPNTPGVRPMQWQNDPHDTFFRKTSSIQDCRGVAHRVASTYHFISNPAVGIPVIDFHLEPEHGEV